MRSKTKKFSGHRPLVVFLMAFFFFIGSHSFAPNNLYAAQKNDEAYKQYIDFFEEVYDMMQKNYYRKISRKDFEDFIKKFKTKIYPQLKKTGKTVDFIRWRSAAYLVDRLKTKEDIFSAFYPPKPAKEYKETALGKRIDLGIEGTMADEGFRVSFVEPRSDAYMKGLRKGNILLSIDSASVFDLTANEIAERLKPLEGDRVFLTYLDEAKKKKTLEVTSKEYFKQTVFWVPVTAPGVYCLEIPRFNRKTGDDLFRFLQVIESEKDIKGLILDLRGNPGGPPLAARQIASFFLPGGDDFAYFEQKGEAKARLNVPTIPAKFHYNGPMVILVNKHSGSASELFSGILQKKGRAVLMGMRTAGQVMLKSMFPLEDDSMLLLITARGRYPNGDVFSFQGLKPNRLFKDPQDRNMIKYASLYFYYVEKKGIK